MYGLGVGVGMCAQNLMLGVSLSALEAAQSHFVNGGGFHDGLLLNIDDLTANKVGRSGQVDVSDGSSLGMRLDVRQASGSMAQYLSGRPEQGSDFATDITGYAEWVAFPGGDLSWDAGRAKYESDVVHRRWSNTSPYISVVDEWFKIEVVYDFGAGNDGQIKIGTAINGTQYHQENVVGSGTYVEWFKATATTVYVTIQNADPTQPQTSYVDEISFKTAPGNHMVAAADDERGTYNIDGDGVAGNTLDGVNDGYSTDAPAAGLYRVLVGMESVDAVGTLFGTESGAHFLGLMQDGNAGAFQSGFGSPTALINLTNDLGVPTRDEFHGGVSIGGKVLVELQQVDLPSVTTLELAKEADVLAASIHDVIWFPEAEVADAQLKDHRNLILGQMGQPQQGDPVYNIFDASKVATAAVGSFNDLTDLTSLFQGRVWSAVSAAPTQENAEIGDSVGLVIDKSLIGSQPFSAWLASATELVPDGGFDVGISNWVEGQGGNELVVAHVNGTIELEKVSGAQYASYAQGFPTTIGDLYRLEGKFIPPDAGDQGWIIKSDGLASYATNRVDMFASQGSERTNHMYFIATATTTYVHLLTKNIIGDKARYDDISLKHIPGIHWYAEADDERPTLQQTDAEVTYLDFDGVNDKLVATGAMTLVDAFQAFRFDADGGVTIGSTDLVNYEAVIKSAGTTFLFEGSASAHPPISFADGVIGSDEIFATRFDNVGGFIRQDQIEKVRGSTGAVLSGTSLQLGARTTASPFNGRMYVTPLLANRLLHGVETYNAEQALENKLTPPVHKLFKDGAGGIRKGGMFDSGDLTSMYKERLFRSVGTNPAIGDSVGFWMDKKHMGGKTAAQFISDQPELIGTQPWTTGTGVSETDDIVTFSGALQYHSAYTDILTVGDLNVVTFTVSGLSGGGSVAVFQGINGGDPQLVVSANGTYVFPAIVASTTILYFRSQTTGLDAVVSNISSKHIPGDHLVAAADDERPTLTADGVKGDGVNDHMDWSANPFSAATSATILSRFKPDTYLPVSPAMGPIYGDFSEVDGSSVYHPHANGRWYSNFGVTVRQDVSVAALLNNTEFHSVEEHITDADEWRLVVNEVDQTPVAVTKDMSGTPELFHTDGFYYEGALKRMMFIDYDLKGYELKAARSWLANG